MLKGSKERSAKVDNMYHAGWAWAGSVPFRSTNLVAAHFGGTRNPMVISWPQDIRSDRTPRSQFHRANDIAPTLYNASRGVYHDGWFACTFGPFIPWDTPGTTARLAKWDANRDEWELYDLTKDFSQADNLADQEPERLANLKELFLSEAKVNKVPPIRLYCRHLTTRCADGSIGLSFAAWRQGTG